MKHAFVDSSCVVAVIFGEPSATTLLDRMQAFDSLHASPLLEAEVFAAMKSEGLESDRSLLARFDWVIPNRPLTAEIDRVLSAGYLRGADCWHLATALFLALHPPDLAILTMDKNQRKTAKLLGFAV